MIWTLQNTIYIYIFDFITVYTHLQSVPKCVRNSFAGLSHSVFYQSKNCHIRFLQYSSFLIFLFTSYVKYQCLIHTLVAVSAAASTITIAAFSAFLIFHNASHCQTCYYDYDSTNNYCSHMILLSDYL